MRKTLFIMVYIFSYLMTLMYFSYSLIKFFPIVIPAFNYAVVIFIVLTILFVLHEFWCIYRDKY